MPKFIFSRSSLLVMAPAWLLLPLPCVEAAPHIEFMSRPYPRIEIFPENIMVPYEASVFPWMHQAEATLPSNYKYILQPFFLQSLNWLC